MVVIFLTNILTSIAQTRSWCLPFNSISSWWHILNQNWKAMTVKHVLVSGNLSDKLFPKGTLSFILTYCISLTGFLRVSNSKRMLYDTTFLSHSLSRRLSPFFLKYLTNAKYVINSWPMTSKSTLMIPNNLVYMWN